MIVVCVNELGGPTGYHKAVIELANGLHRGGHDVAVLAFQGSGDGSGQMIPTWPLDPDIPAMSLRSLPADGGRLLHRNYHSVFSVSQLGRPWHYTENHLVAIRQLNAALTVDDTLIFTSTLTAVVVDRALDGVERRPRTLLQVHGDYRHHTELWDQMMTARASIDGLQTVSSGLRDQFLDEFPSSDVTFAPNFPGRIDAEARIEHDGVNIVLPASFQPRKNQGDAIRALALIEDESVHLTLWGDARTVYAKECIGLAQDLGLSHRVHVPGFGTSADIYGRADIVLMTSLSEGFGFPLLEAGLNSLPTVTYDFEFGPRDAIVDGESGFIVPVGDVERLGRALALLAGDPELREKVGRRAREIYQERFAESAVLPRYEAIIGKPQGARVHLRELFTTDGLEPLAASQVAASSIGVGRFRREVVRVSSPVVLHDIQVDSGTHVREAHATRAGGVTRITYESAGSAVISYVTSPGSSDRHYLATTLPSGGLAVLPYLRRDAQYGDGTPPSVDTIFPTALPLVGFVQVQAVAKTARTIVRKGARDVAWKIRQLTGARTGTFARPVVGDAVVEATTPGIALGDAPLNGDASPTDTSVDSPGHLIDDQKDGAAVAPDSDPVDGATSDALPDTAVPAAAPGVAVTVPPAANAGGMLKKARRLAGAYGSTLRSMALPLVTTPAGSARREVPRHPRFPVTSGIDNFGTTINAPGGVVVANAGTSVRPTVSLYGEFDWVDLVDGSGTRRIESPLTYGELFEGICAAEREYGLFDIQTRDGIHPWELGRQYLVGELARALGLWGSPSSTPLAPNIDVYGGSKRLTTAPPARRVIYDFHRRGQSDYRIAAFRDEDSMVIVQPDPHGYPEVTETNRVWPVREYNQWVASTRRRLAAARVPDVDSRPFQEALTRSLGINVDLSTHLRRFLLTFVHEREFWTPVFERIKPEEVVIASPLRFGIAVAAQRAGAVASEIQYALTSRYHGTFWYGGRPHHSATRFYTWSDYWSQRTNVYDECIVVPRSEPEFTTALAADTVLDPTWDVCVIAQNTVFRRMMAFVADLVRERPELRIVIAPHPGAPLEVRRALAAAGMTDRVEISDVDTLTTIRRSAIALGSYSTSVWEAAALGRPTYVLPLPGYELALDDIASGLFRLAMSPHDLVPYEVPESRHTVFGGK